MQIGKLQKLSLNDFNDKLACVVYLTGCNWRCPFCYNASLVLPEKIKKGQTIPEKEFFSFLLEKRELLQGVVISGGEPTINNDLPKFVSKIKKLGFFIKLDTNGSNPEMINYLIKNNLIDYVTIDIKAPKEKYTEIIGFKGCSPFWLIENIEKSINLIKKSKIDYEFKTTIVKPFLDRNDVLKIARWIGPAKKYSIQLFKNGDIIDKKLESNKQYDPKEISKIAKTAWPFFESFQIRQ